MKTKSILCLLFVCCSWSLFAQDDNSQTIIVEQTTTSTPKEKKPTFWIGPKFGLDISSETRDIETVQDGLKDNYQAGILMQFGRTLYLQPEIYYATQKVTSLSGTSSINSIRVPLMLGLRFFNLGLFSLHVTGGPAFSFKLDDADKISGEKAMTWQVGAGVDVLGFITTDLRYTVKSGVSVADQISQFTTNPSVLNLTVGLKLR
jgi:hypothetical protein